MKIGCIYTAFNTVEYLRPSLQPWIEARRTQLGGHTFVICAVNCAFEGFENPPTDDGTAMILQADRSAGFIDHVVTSEGPIKETEARGRALQWLVTQQVTHIWQHDSDEFATIEDIAAIIRFVEARPYLDWARLSLKNQVFTPSQYLVEPFTPARLHKVHIAGGYVAAGFHQDNNVYYKRPWNGERVLDTQLCSTTVPKSVAWIRHASWLNNRRSKMKIAYQTKRWGADKCTFTWDNSRGGLIFNPAMPAPEIAREGEGDA